MNRFTYSIIILIGAASYGVLATIVKLALEQGFEVAEIVGSQYFFGWLLLLIPLILCGRKKVSAKSVFLLLIVGTTSSLTGIFYSLALSVLPASIAVVLLFQFTWIGIVITAIIERRLPNIKTIGAILLLLIGTFAAGGIFENKMSGITPMGIGFGLLAAVTFSLFIIASGKVALQITTVQRTFFMTTGALLLTFIVYSPSFLYSSAMSAGLWKYGVLLGVFGIAIPIFCFSLGSPRVGSNLATILGSAELPSAVLVSMIILKEDVSVFQWAGILLILSGIMLPQLEFNLKKRKISTT